MKYDIKKLAITFISDIVLAAMIIGLFAYDVLLAPKPATPITLTPPASTHEFQLPSTESTLPDISATPISTEIERENFSASGLSALGYDIINNKKYGISPYNRVVTQIADDVGRGARYVIYEVKITTEDDCITYYTVDLFVNRVTDLLTNVCVNNNGELSSDDVPMQADYVDAALAISGDFFKNSKIGYIVRNGMLYRDEPSKNDYCLLYNDGRLECIDGTFFDNNKEEYEKDVWQCWAFGPTLFTPGGSVIDDPMQFNINGGRYHNTNPFDHSESGGIQNKHPRSAIGYVEPGHYLLMLVDGRREGHSSGASLTELSQLMYDEGCTAAYNLDGGRSAVLWYKGQVINKPYKDGRDISDIIYVRASGEETVS